MFLFPFRNRSQRFSGNTVTVPIPTYRCFPHFSEIRIQTDKTFVSGTCTSAYFPYLFKCEKKGNAMRHTTISPLMIIHFAAPLGSGTGNYGESSRCILCQNRHFTGNTIGQFLICRICTSLSCNTFPVYLISLKSDSPLFFSLFPTFSFRENKSLSLSLYIKRVTEERHTRRKGREN